MRDQHIGGRGCLVVRASRQRSAHNLLGEVGLGSVGVQKRAIVANLRTRGGSLAARLVIGRSSLVGYGRESGKKVGYCWFLQLAHPAQLRRITNTVRATMFVRCWRA